MTLNAIQITFFIPVNQNFEFLSFFPQLFIFFFFLVRGNFLAVQWLELHALTAMGLGSIPGQGTSIPQAVWYGQKIKNKNKISCKKKN